MNIPEKVAADHPGYEFSPAANIRCTGCGMGDWALTAEAADEAWRRHIAAVTVQFVQDGAAAQILLERSRPTASSGSSERGWQLGFNAGLSRAARILSNTAVCDQ